MNHIGTVDIGQESLTIIYDTASGAILHTHHVVTERGGHHPPQKTLEADALHQFKGLQPGHASTTGILHAKADALKAAHHYRVDLTHKTLIEHSATP